MGAGGGRVLARVSELFANGRVVDLVLAIVLLEAVFLWVRHAHTGKGPAPGNFLGNLAAGACLLLALRAALSGAPWPWIAVFLAAALPAHLFDLWKRWAP